MREALIMHSDAWHARLRGLARDGTGISWADFTANAWIGCTRVKAVKGALSGCDWCYAESQARHYRWAVWGDGEARMHTVGFDAKVDKLQRAAVALGRRFSVFSLSLGDWLDPEVSEERRRRLVDAVERSPDLDWLLLTHRPHLIRKLAWASWRAALPANIWPGVTVDHALHGRRWDQLLEAWGSTGRCWVSAEPLLSSMAGVDFDQAVCVIAGGASNTHDERFALEPAHVHELVERYGRKLHFKQWGTFRHGQHMSKEAAGRDLDGMVHDWTPWRRSKAEFATALGATA